MKPAPALLGSTVAALLSLGAAALLLGGDGENAARVRTAGPAAAPAASVAAQAPLVTFDPAPDPEARGATACAVTAGDASGARLVVEPAPAAAPASAAAAAGALSGLILDDQGRGVLAPGLRLVHGATGEERLLGPGQLGLEAGGRFRIELPPGTWTIVASAPEHRDSAPVTVDVPAGGDAASRPLVLTRQGILRGTFALPRRWQAQLPRAFRVVLEVSSDAAPSVESMDREPPVTVRREELWLGTDRSFELRGCEPGLYRIRLEAPEAGWASAWAQSWLDPGQVHDGLRLSCVEEAPVSLEGRVLDEHGLPVEGATVAVGALAVTSDGRGAFALRGLDLGPQALSVSREGYAATREGLEFAGEPLRVSVVLPRASGS